MSHSPTGKLLAMTDNNPDIEVAVFDPVRVFEQTIFDLARVAEVFGRDDSGMTAEDFLHAAKAAGDRLKATSTVTLTGLTQSVADKIPADVRARYQQQVELDNLMASPEDEQRRMLKALRGVARWQRRAR